VTVVVEVDVTVVFVAVVTVAVVVVLDVSTQVSQSTRHFSRNAAPTIISAHSSALDGQSAWSGLPLQVPGGSGIDVVGGSADVVAAAVVGSGHELHNTGQLFCSADPKIEFAQDSSG
jgi:hypothetical protein